MADVQTDV